METPLYSEERKFIKAFMKHTTIKFPAFYCLPKLHKNGPIKGRPIAGAVASFTTPISRILNHRLAPHLAKLPYILKNSTQLVQHLEAANDHIPKEELLIITGDINSLYPNIDIEKLKVICKTTDFELESLANFVLDNSYVEYNDLIYKQKNGIPMGTNAAVHLANLYLSELLDKYIGSRQQTFYYGRYIDDIFIIWKGSLESWNNCRSCINNLYPNLKIDDWHESRNHAIFLDLNITFVNGRFYTSVYQKELNKYFYLTPESFHQPHTFSGFIKGELTRYARLSSTGYSYEQVKKLFYQRLLNRGYSRLYLNTIFKKHKWTIREIAKDRPVNVLLPFVIPYTPRRNMKYLESLFKKMEESFEEYIPTSKVTLVYSKTPNLLQLVCSSSLNKDQKLQLLDSRDYSISSSKSGEETCEIEEEQIQNIVSQGNLLQQTNDNYPKRNRKRKISGQKSILDFFKKTRKF
jgi:hypothetical protein